MYETERQHLDISGLQLNGRILDVGGGGEAILSRCFGNRVVAIDKRRGELQETPDIGLKIVMDACKMGFLNNTFDHVTCFFTLMYMDEREVREFLLEARRVLRPGGCLWIWDAVIPEPPTDDVFVIQLEVTLSETERVTTGYGIRWISGQSAEGIAARCEQAGFAHDSIRASGRTFAICVRK